VFRKAGVFKVMTWNVENLGPVVLRRAARCPVVTIVKTT
jgi:hypothetical protein